MTDAGRSAPPTLPSDMHFINPGLAAMARDPRALIVHPHAQRTGGNAFRRVLMQVFGPDRVYSRASGPALKKWNTLTDADVAGFQAYTDHFDFIDNRLTRPVLPIALLRHPLYRAASLYGFVKRKDGHIHQPLANTSTLETFYQRGSAENPVYFRNLQCRRICGIPDARIALDYVRERYLGVGFTENIASFASALGISLGWTAFDLPHARSDSERYSQTFSPAFRDMVLSQNAEDLALYEAMINGAPCALPPRSAFQEIPLTLRKVAGKARSLADRLFQFG